MRINGVNNVDYVLRFRHVLPNASVEEKGGTWCYIKIADPNAVKEEDLKIKSIGYTTLHYTENGRLDKTVGRLKSLQYALGMRKDVEFKEHIVKIKALSQTLTVLGRQIGGLLGKHCKDLVIELTEYTKLPLYGETFTRAERTQFWKAYHEQCHGNKLTLKESKKLLAEALESCQTKNNLAVVADKILDKVPELKPVAPKKNRKKKGESANG